MYDTIGRKRSWKSNQRIWRTIYGHVIEQNPPQYVTAILELGKVKYLMAQTYAMIVDYYIYYYNNHRPYSSMNYLPPIEAFRCNSCPETTII